MILKVFAILLLVAAGLQPSFAASTEAALLAWLDSPAPAQVPAPGTRLEHTDIMASTALLAPGYIDSFNFAGAALTIQATGDYTPWQAYLDASARHAGSASLAADGSIVGHVAGLPFSHAQIDAADADKAGYMVAWNNIFRWHYYGYRSKPLTMYYLRSHDRVAGGERPPGIGGDAAIERSVDMWFHRAYLQRLAMLPESGYGMDVSGSDGTHYKDFMEITAPFDVAGAKFIIERSLDPFEDDQVNSYLPTERRVRRLSAQERADSFMGTDYTFDDFEGFSGRVMDYEWELAGERTILAVADSSHDRVHVFGPDSRVPDDRWQLRDCYVVKMVPRWDGHPYGAKYVFIDKQTWLVQLALVYDRSGKHWKTIDPIWQYPERDDLQGSPSASVGRWIATIGVDLARGTTTVSQALKTDIPPMKASAVRRLFDVSALNEGR